MTFVTFTAWHFWLAFATAFMAMSIVGRHVRGRWHAPSMRKVLLLAFSVGFYAWVAGKLVFILMASVLANHTLTSIVNTTVGRLRQAIVATAVTFNVALLAVFKYAYFVADWWPNSNIDLALQTWRLDQWMLPIGLSFFTFQAISYVVDVHRGTLEKPADLLSFATYLCFFPQLVAGPIVRAKQFLPQLESESWVCARNEDKQHIQRILNGFLKKVMLGDFIGAWIVDPVFAEPLAWSSAEIWIALYGYSLQVYADFSGYTDMAKGMAGLLGIKLPENFRLPYRATSPGDFWRRWHITLSSWWKDYVYIPMGGNRRFSGFSLACVVLAWAAVIWQVDNVGVCLVVSGVGLLMAATLLLYPEANRRAANAVNVLLIMLMGGLWHGAHMNFIIWGGLNGLVLSTWILLPSNSTTKLWSKALGWFVTFHSVVAIRIWFRAGSLVHMGELPSTPHPSGAWNNALALWQALTQSSVEFTTLHWQPEYGIGLSLLGVGYGLHFMPSSRQGQMERLGNRIPMWAIWVAWSMAAAASVWCTEGQTRPFIYWQF